ncbi:MAG: anti-sigma factor domain-containing protein [Clostridia bacterium]|nr:anti-sigma factor domain-containing protein [Clostridia bacterium]
MINIGIIVKIFKDKAIVMTSDYHFHAVKRKEKMQLGQQIYFTQDDLIHHRSKLIKIGALVASTAALFILLFALFSSFPGQSDIYAYVDVDINPSIEFSIDKNSKIIDVSSFNPDGLKLVESLEFKNMQMKDALSGIVEKSREYGYIHSKDKNFILISASLNEKNHEYKEDKDQAEKKLDVLLASFNDMLAHTDKESMDAKILKVSPENRKAALQNNLTMGRYYVFVKAKSSGFDISIEDMKTVPLGGIWAKLGYGTPKKENPIPSSPNPSPIFAQGADATATPGILHSEGQASSNPSKIDSLTPTEEINLINGTPPFSAILFLTPVPGNHDSTPGVNATPLLDHNRITPGNIPAMNQAGFGTVNPSPVNSIPPKQESLFTPLPDNSKVGFTPTAEIPFTPTPTVTPFIFIPQHSDSPVTSFEPTHFIPRPCTPAPTHTPGGWHPSRIPRPTHFPPTPNVIPTRPPVDWEIPYFTAPPFMPSRPPGTWHTPLPKPDHIIRTPLPTIRIPSWDSKQWSIPTPPWNRR